MPYSYSNSIYSTDTIPIPETYPYYNYQQHQAHSLVSQAPHAITFSTSSPTTLPMTDHHDHNIDIRDLDARLARVEQLQHQENNYHQQEEVPSTNQTSIHGGRPRPPLDTSLLPRFTKSSTMSTTSTTTSSASATTHLHPESVRLAPGAFSKPRVPRRSRRETFSSAHSGRSTRGGRARSEDGHQQQEFRYYGRHGNQWLFNDFSVTEAVARGVRRVFSGSSGKDWYEERK